ncbi:hypothetical protein DPMN_089890 [Dreissena polymorpha]|uniref:non-specific serine/threonine protein kinase n=1 Tax=Dreissena polymorpha TaxID=45954 RepID=A0A9D4KWR9_DREPO|nr:hypothetical protein DPMN_089890 [Dreissena polymorpha]
MVLEELIMENGGSGDTENGTGADENKNRNSLERVEPERKITPFERLSQDLSDDPRVLKEITLGKRIGFYRIRGELGSGNFSQVKMGIHVLTKEKVAIKILDKTKLDQKTQRLLSREISSMERLHHPNIIRLYEVVETLAKLHIVMEYAGGGELFTKISNEGKLAEPEARHIFSQVAAAIDHMQLETLQQTLKDYNSVASLKADQLKKLGQLYSIDPKFPKKARIVLLCYVLGLSTTGHIQTVATRDSCQHLNDDQQKH